MILINDIDLLLTCKCDICGKECHIKVDVRCEQDTIKQVQESWKRCGFHFDSIYSPVYCDNCNIIVILQNASMKGKNKKDEKTI